MLNPATALNTTDVIAWLETKDPKGFYNYCSPCNCLFAQFLTAQGYEQVHCSSIGFGVTVGNGPEQHGNIPSKINFIALGINYTTKESNNEWTYGAALERARLVDKTEKTTILTMIKEAFV